MLRRAPRPAASRTSYVASGCWLRRPGTRCRTFRVLRPDSALIHLPIRLRHPRYALRGKQIRLRRTHNGSRKALGLGALGPGTRDLVMAHFSPPLFAERTPEASAPVSMPEHMSNATVAGHTGRKTGGHDGAEHDDIMYPSA